MKALRCEHTWKSFRKENGFFNPFKRNKKEVIDVIKDISFEVGEGEIFGILGPNGSGKSTLIRIISTLLLPDKGSIDVFGKSAVRDRYQVRRFINRVSVDAAFFKKLSAMENLSYAARLYNLGVKEARKRAVEIMKRLGLPENKMTCSMENLSRGMQQKVAISRALLTSPILLLLDEPTTGLDPKSKQDVQKFILEVYEKHNTTILLTTHDMGEAERMCHRLALIDQGRFVALDTPDGLKSIVRKNNGGKEVSMEDVFLELTGKELVEE